MKIPSHENLNNLRLTPEDKFGTFQGETIPGVMSLLQCKRSLDEGAITEVTLTDHAQKL